MADEEFPMSQPCPRCGDRGYRIDRSYTLGEVSVRDIDRTLRHVDDGTVAVQPDGTVVCDKRKEDR
jgi:hypothetical protein